MRKLLGYKYLVELNIYNFNIFNFGKVFRCHSFTVVTVKRI